MVPKLVNRDDVAEKCESREAQRARLATTGQWLHVLDYPLWSGYWLESCRVAIKL